MLQEFLTVADHFVTLCIKRLIEDKSTVIKQKGESQNGGNKKTNHTKFSGKQTFLTP